MNDPRAKIGAGETLREEAIAWFTRLRGEQAGALQAEFEGWRARSPAHDQAYRNVADLFDKAAVLKQSRSVEDPVPPRNRARSWLAGLARAAAIGAIALVGLALLRPQPVSIQQAPRLAAAQPLATGRGEIRTFKLADGTRVTLDTASRIEVSIDIHERRLRLRAGRARIAVAADARPFVVEVGAGQVTSGDGTFDVAYDDADRVNVTLLAGAAEAGPTLQEATYTVAVRPLLTGRPTSFRADDFSDLPRAAAQTRIDDRDWPTGWAEYRAISLAGIAGEANRYSSVPILLDDPATGALSVSGRFRLTDSDALAGRLAEVFGLTARHEADGLHLSTAK